MMRLLAPVMLLTWVGAALLLGELRWFRRPRLIDRLRPRVASGTTSPAGSPLVDDRSSTAALLDRLRRMAPIAERGGDRLASALGVAEPLAIRLLRVHSPLGPVEFRSRQVARSIASAALVVLLTLTVHVPVAFAALSGTGAALVCFLMIEQRLATRSEAWKRRIFLELPVMSEQLGMLLSAGHSLGQALTRIARRSDAAISLDLSVVVGRLQQGVEEAAALREWSDIAGVPALDRLLSVLALNREATDLGSLITVEARATSAEVHRELIEQLERRAQQVWIPVTVATLVPGVLFLAVPFLEAVRLFTTS